MSPRFDDEDLRRMRNDIAFARVFAALNWPSKVRDRQLAFVCPRCGEYRSAVNPRTNLARCFFCEINFNPIDFTIAVQNATFVEAVRFLEPLLPPRQDGEST